ncbi:MAG: ATP-binding cassette domain-containing protein, partial [Deltaproteobacteria bacterium]|nr:ATP-binding cassette domain-containing protein [Deltaproteobacteria bacterium]
MTALKSQLPSGQSLEGQVLLELRNVTKNFGGHRVISETSLKVRGGRLLYLLGPSGIGKTTLIEIMSGLSKPDSGQVIQKTPPSVLFQDNLLIAWLNSLANLTYILPKSLSANQAEKLALNWLETFELEPQAYPRALSGGMKRRLALARSLAADRWLLILDEPFAFLDQRWHQLIAAQVAQKVLAGAAVVMSGHFAPEPLLALLPGRLDSIELSSQPIHLS